MKRTPVESSCLRSVGYDAKTKTLEVEFVDSRIYQYFEVPRSEYRALLTADSVGRYYTNNIRDDYPYLPVSGKSRP